MLSVEFKEYCKPKVRQTKPASLWQQGASCFIPPSDKCWLTLQVVAEANKPEWSGGHRGLQTYIQRLVHPTWDSKLVVANKTNPQSLATNMTDDNLKVLLSTVSAGCCI